jgi:hypothetical protein
MEIQDALSFLFQRTNATQTFWNFYVTVATALLAFLAAAKTPWINKAICFVLTIGFLVFAAANFGALNQTITQRAALISLIPKLASYDPSLQGVIKSSMPPTACELKLFHGALDAAIVALIWIIPYIRRRYASANNSPIKKDTAKNQATD